jgi:uncharacterized protein
MADVRVAELWRYPVKSMQGSAVESLEVTRRGVVGDRAWALFDATTGKLMSAKRWSALLMATARSNGDRTWADLPSGQSVDLTSADAAAELSAWLGRPVEVRRTRPGMEVVYEMTLDPPNDEAELFDIPAPPGAFVDLAPIHLLSSATLAGGAEAYPDLDWSVRRFRPNIVVEGIDQPFGEDTLTGLRLRVGGAVLHVAQPTVRCAMPLRAQPGLSRQPELYAALDELHANHLGVYVDVVEPAALTVGDTVEVIDPTP